MPTASGSSVRDPDMARFTTIPVPYGPSDVDWFLNHVATGWAEGSLAAFAVEVAGRFAGSADLRLQEGKWAEVGFGLAPWARSRSSDPRPSPAAGVGFHRARTGRDPVARGRG